MKQLKTGFECYSHYEAKKSNVLIGGFVAMSAIYFATMFLSVVWSFAQYASIHY